MIRVGVAALALLVAWLWAPPTAHSQGTYAQMNCGQLWHARNSIYAAKGYCFQTARARSVFGAGCFPPYGQLTPPEQQEVALIQQWESYNGCR